MAQVIGNEPLSAKGVGLKNKNYSKNKPIKDDNGIDLYVPVPINNFNYKDSENVWNSAINSAQVASDSAAAFAGTDYDIRNRPGRQKYIVDGYGQWGDYTPISDLSYSKEELKNDWMENYYPKITDYLQKNVMDPLSDMQGLIKDLYNGNTDSIMNAISSLGGNFSSMLKDMTSSSAKGYSSLASAINSGAKSIADANVSSTQSLMDIIQKTTDANNAWSAEQAQINRDWQERMSNTAIQRQMADYKAAGLNPALAAGAGSGASVGSGAVAQGDTSNTRLFAEVAMQAIDAAQTSAAALSRVSTADTDKSILGKLINNNGSKAFIRAAASAAGQIGVRALASYFGVPGFIAAKAASK